MKKKLTALALVVVMVAMLFTGLTMAYFTDNEEVTNVFTVGSIEIDVFENELKEDGSLDPDSEVEENLYENVVPGVAYPKNPTIRNTGDNGAYARMLVTVPYDLFMSIAGKGITDLTTVFDGHDAGLWNRADIVLDEARNTVTYVYNYNGILTPDAEVALFTSFTLPGALTQEDLSAWNAFYIRVTGEAIQAEGFADAAAAFEELGEVAAPIEGVEIILEAKKDVPLEVAAGEETLIIGTYIQAPYFQNNGTATVSDVEMKAGTATDYSNITRGADAETTYNDVEIISGGGGVAAADGAEVTFNSGSVYVDTTSTSGRYIFYAVGEGTEITINGGEFSWDPLDNQKRAYIYAEAGTTVYVNGGTFGKASTRSGYTDGILGTGTVVIKGGTFGFDPTKWVADGYVATETSGVWTVTAQ